MKLSELKIIIDEAIEHFPNGDSADVTLFDENGEELEPFQLSEDKQSGVITFE